MNKIEIIINSQNAATDKKKTAAFPRRRTDPYGRRRGGNFIEFYDLAQVSGDGVTFTDHPLLKVPSYSTSFSSSGSASKLIITMDQFGTADYQAYTDMMFEVPIEEWHVRYKRLEYTPALEAYSPGRFHRLTTPHPAFFSIANKGGTQANPFKPMDGVDPDIAAFELASDVFFQPDPAAYAKGMLREAGLSWWETPNGKAPTRGLTYLESEGIFGSDSEEGTQSWFTFSTQDKVNYKVTTTNDPDAADVGVIAPSGLTRIFLMPQITSWMASTSNADLENKYIMGPVYQITPRRTWPTYIQRDYEHSNGNYTVLGTVYNAVIDDPNGRKADFLDYQAARGGMQASSWVRGTIGSSTAVAFNGAMSPLSWPVGDNYFSQGSTSAADVGIWQDAGGFNGAGGSANPYRADLTIETSEGAWFDTTDPFLCAVIQKGSTFYYVWMLEGAGSVTSVQGVKYRLSLRYDKTFADLLRDDLFYGTPV